VTTQTIAVETIVAAPIEQVWRAYTSPEDIKTVERRFRRLAHDGGERGPARRRSILVADGSQGRQHRIRFRRNYTRNEQERLGWQAILDNFARHVATARQMT
jgi:hypothetical protein